MFWLLKYAELSSLIAGAFFLGLAVRNLMKGIASRGWSQTTGTISRAFVLVETDPEGNKGFTPSIEFEYVVEGNRYKGSRLRYGQVGSSNRERAERTIAGYPVGTSVSVFFDPRNPKDSVLLCGTSWGNLFIAAAGIAFLGTGFVLHQVKR
jgi:hypothetical protein